MISSFACCMLLALPVHICYVLANCCVLHHASC
jgi:hypothetical protein